jgi:DNA-directed RNA polymerase specialized sigma24 family protein
VSEDEFNDLVEAWEPKLDTHARSQRVPGLDRDEVKAEMLECLWRAVVTFDEAQGVTLEPYWWRIWINRKGDLIARHFATKRRAAVISGDMTWVAELADDLYPLLRDMAGRTSAESLQKAPECPLSDSMTKKVWTLLAAGFQAQEVRVMLELSLRRYYRIIHALRTVYGEVAV